MNIRSIVAVRKIAPFLNILAYCRVEAFTFTGREEGSFRNQKDPINWRLINFFLQPNRKWGGEGGRTEPIALATVTGRGGRTQPIALVPAKPVTARRLGIVGVGRDRFNDDQVPLETLRKTPF